MGGGREKKKVKSKKKGCEEQGTMKREGVNIQYTVKRVDEVVPHRHLVTQDQTTQVSNKFFHIHVEFFR